MRLVLSFNPFLCLGWVGVFLCGCIMSICNQSKYWTVQTTNHINKEEKKDRLMMDENHRMTNGDGIITWCRRAPYIVLDFSLLQVFVDTQMAQVNSVRADKLTVREASLPVCLSSLCTREGTQAYTDPLMHVFLSCGWIIVHINIYNLWTYSGHTQIEITSDLFSFCSHAPLEVEGGYLHCRACQLFAWMPWFV